MAYVDMLSRNELRQKFREAKRALDKYRCLNDHPFLVVWIQKASTGNSRLPFDFAHTKIEHLSLRAHSLDAFRPRSLYEYAYAAYDLSKDRFEDAHIGL